MTIKEFKDSTIYKEAKRVNYFDLNGKNISNKPRIILDLLQVIGASNNNEGIIDVDVNYIE